MADSAVTTPAPPAPQIPSATPRSVPTRRIAFDSTVEGLPRHFTADGDLMSSHLVVALSSLFPDGEDFFVRSVRHYRDQITDPELKAQVAGFIGQEALHGREHRMLNGQFDRLGYPSRFFAGLTRRTLGFRTKVAPPVSNLAATAALEHFTATLGELLLSDEELRRLLGHPGVRDLFVWHALEECEHKAVAFDVYRAVGGSERLRVITMKLLRAGFVGAVVTQMLVSLLGDRETYRRGVLRRSWARLRRSPMLRRDVWDQLKDYDRPDFHPDDRNTDQLVAEWRERLFGDEGRLRDQLVGRTAV
jgi:uncharacterized protein